ncbi:BrxA family protein [Deinococcus terrestris]|nr:BrxA family protein [Deinococcus terrestris]
MPMTRPTYTALTNTQFLLAESSQVAQALLEGADWALLRRAAQEGRLFGRGRASSQLTVLTALRGRFHEVPREVLPELAAGTLEARRLLVLGMITRRKPLLRDFIGQVLLHQWQRLAPRVTDADARAFLTHQAEQHPEVATWSPATQQKTRGNLTRFLVDAGLLKESRQGEFEILPQYLSPQVRAAVHDLDPHLPVLLEALK